MLNTFKKFNAFLLAIMLTLFCVVPTTTYAKESNDFELPEDAKILYQDENAVLYQSKTETSISRSPMDFSYGRA